MFLAKWYLSAGDPENLVPLDQFSSGTIAVSFTSEFWVNIFIGLIGFERATEICYSIRHMKLSKSSTKTSGLMESAPTKNASSRKSNLLLLFFGNPYSYQ